ncbi:branched-chain amino acid ABC transporter substrate-binding protein [Rhizobium leguminosarum]|uniref:branched-chain amino acid ABC transporter substrate-binding protein n=1 Tax=Rhizobium leguminosarum TaxID=384 RepID=UPI003F9A43F6
MNSIGNFALAASISLLAVTNAHADIMVGIAGPLTGPNAAVGQQFRQGAEHAAAAINASGGIGGEDVVLVYGDDASDPKQGVSVANRFVADGVQFVIGHYNSGVSIPASLVYEENGILEITPGSTNPTYTERQLWNTFRVCGRDDQQGAVAARYISANFKDKKVAVIHDKTPYGAGIAAEVQKGLASLDFEIALTDSVNVGDKDFGALISKLKDAGIDLVYFGGVYTEAGLLVRQAADQGLKAVLFGGDGITSAEFGQIAGKAGEGTLMTFAPDPRELPLAKPVVEQFRKEGFEPEAYTLYAYGALQVIKAGIEASDTSDAALVADRLHHGLVVETVLGKLAFNAKGDRKDEDYTVYGWKTDENGKLAYSMLSQ